MSLADLTRRAIEVARGHALGRRLNTTTAILVSSIVETPQAALGSALSRCQDFQSGHAEGDRKRALQPAPQAEIPPRDACARV